MPEQITLNLGEVVDAWNATGAIQSDLALPPAAGFLVNFWHETLTPAAKAFDESRQAMLAKYGHKQPDGNLWSFPTVEARLQFDAEVEGLKTSQTVEFFMDRIPRELVAQAQGTTKPVHLTWLNPIMTARPPLEQPAGPTPKGE